MPVATTTTDITLLFVHPELSPPAVLALAIATTCTVVHLVALSAVCTQQCVQAAGSAHMSLGT